MGNELGISGRWDERKELVGLMKYPFPRQLQKLPGCAGRHAANPPLYDGEL